MNYTYENLEIGQQYAMKRTLNMEEVRIFAQVTGDDNPIHIDYEYAQNTPFGKPIVHGVFLMGLVSKALGRDFPGPGSVAVSIETKFLRPVAVGEEVTIEIEILEKLPRNQIKVRTAGYIVVRDRKKIAFDGSAILIPPTA
ncbi:MAG: MaoC family dehydratase [Rhodothermia bacterium]|nr:MaoC family dehydratase [Rhodothermia bacterium]